MKLTAATITDEQIQAAYHEGLISYDLLEFATFPAWKATHHYYRERCAVLLNAHAVREEAAPCPECHLRDQIEETDRLDLTSDQAGCRWCCTRCNLVYGHPDEPAEAP